jgi:hypothetical protein
MTKSQSTSRTGQTWTVDVWFSTTFPVTPDQDWRRVIVTADDPTEAELIACQIVARLGTPTRSSVLV